MISSRDGTTVAPATTPVPDSLVARPSPLRRRRSPWAEIWRWGVTLVAFCLAALVVAGLVLVVAIYRQARTDQVHPAQAIVVLGTAQYNGWPGPVFRARLDRAIDLWRAGYAPVLVVTGGKMPGDGYTEAEAAWAYLTDAGVPAEVIVTENAASDTWESMQGIAALLRPLGIDQVIVVSDGFHLFRTRMMARDVGLWAWGSPAEMSPIRAGGGGELSYVIREAAAVVAHLWQTRVAGYWPLAIGYRLSAIGEFTS
jgi:vancomycin permeability regulator SanA